MRYTAFGSGVSTEIGFPWGEDQWIALGYTAFGSGVSTEISDMFTRVERVAPCYTAFGSGVSTEMKPDRVSHSFPPLLHSLRLRGEH